MECSYDRYYDTCKLKMRDGKFKTCAEAAQQKDRETAG